MTRKLRAALQTVTDITTGVLLEDAVLMKNTKLALCWLLVAVFTVWLRAQQEKSQ